MDTVLTYFGVCACGVCVCVSLSLGYPPEQAVDVALKTVREYLNDHDHCVSVCVWVCASVLSLRNTWYSSLSQLLFLFSGESKERADEDTHTCTNSLSLTLNTPKMSMAKSVF